MALLAELVMYYLHPMTTVIFLSLPHHVNRTVKMNKWYFCSIVLSTLVVLSSSFEIRSFFLNKHADLLRKPFSLASGRECVHTTRTDIKLTEEITICYRQKPYMIRGKSGVFTFGTLDETWSDFQYGFTFGVWNSGAWLGYKEKGKPLSWINMGRHRIEIHAWRHTCITLNFKTGVYTSTENGLKRKEDTYKRLTEIGKKLNFTIDIVTIGCWFVPKDGISTYGELSEYGEFTDFQMFGTILSQEELNRITGCELRKEGDIISWDNETWYLNGTEKTTEIEVLDYKKEICDKKKTGFLLVPIKQKGLPFGLADTCEKIGGRVSR